jgi:hypothetical protein
MTVPVFSTGEVLTASAMNSVGMWLVKTQSISGTSTQINDCFTSDYQSYMVVVSGLTSSTVDFITARLVAGTSPDTTSNYYSSSLQVQNDGTVSGIGGAAGVSYWNTGLVGFTTAGGGTMAIFNPQSSTLATAFNSQGIDTRTNGAPLRNGAGSFQATTSFQGLWLSTLNGGYTMSGTVRVYGYRN